jgi:WD40 repeat protein
VRLWDADSGAAVDAIPLALMVPKTAALSFDGNLVAVGFETSGIWLWNRQTATPAKFETPQPITDLAFHPDGQTLFAASADGTLRAVRLSDGQSPFVVNHGSAIHDLVVSHNGQWLATAGENNQLRVWQSANGTPAPLQPATNFRGAVRAAAFSLDDSKVIGASGGDTAEQIAFDVNTGVALQRFTEHAKPVTAMVAGPANDQMITLAPTDAARIWSIQGGQTIPGHGQPVTALAAVRTTPLQVFSGSVDATVRRWNLDNGQQLQQFNHGAAVTSISVRPDGLRLAAAGSSNVARLWNVENNQQIAELRGDVRARSLVTRLNQQLQTQTARLNQAKQRMDTADQTLPMRTEAEKKAADALAAANKSVEEKQAVVRTTMDAKVAQEKLAIEAAATAQKAVQAKDEADKRAMEATVVAQRAQERANRLLTASQNNSSDKDLAAAATAAQNASPIG